MFYIIRHGYKNILIVHGQTDLRPEAIGEYYLFLEQKSKNQLSVKKSLNSCFPLSITFKICTSNKIHFINILFWHCITVAKKSLMATREKLSCINEPWFGHTKNQWPIGINMTIVNLNQEFISWNPLYGSHYEIFYRQLAAAVTLAILKQHKRESLKHTVKWWKTNQYN